MNKNYRIVWSAARQAYVVADEKARTRGKSSTLRTATALAAATLLAPMAWAYPPGCVSGANVIDAESSITSCTLLDDSYVTISGTGVIDPETNDVPSILVESGISAVSITNAGKVTGSTTTAVIEIDGGSLSDGIRNESTGEIINYAESDGTGIDMRNGAVINNGIFNDGTISAAWGGIAMSLSTVDGGIHNSGTISADYGIWAAYSEIEGGIDNSNLIEGSSTGIYLESVLISSGGITNSGTIRAENNGIYTWESTIDSITNAATGKISALGTAVVIDDDTTITNNFTNMGLIESTDDGYGIYFRGTLEGDLVNEQGATIRSTGGDTGIGLLISDSAINAVQNDGLIQGGLAGIVINGGQINDALTNTGTLSGSTFAIGVYPGSNLATLKIVGDHAQFIGDVAAPDTDVVVKSGAVFSTRNAFVVRSFTVEEDATVNLSAGVSTANGYELMGDPLEIYDGITALNGLTNKGELAVGSSVTSAIYGSYEQKSTGALKIGVAGDNAYGKLVVHGTATLPSNATLIVDVKPGASLSSDRLQGVLSADALVSDGTFNVVEHSFLFDFGAEKVDNRIDLTVQKVAALRQTAIDAGNTPGVGAATALDHILEANPGSAIGSYFAGLSNQQQISRAITETLPLLTGASTTAASSALSSINRVIQARMDANAGLSSGDAFLTDKHLWLKPFGSWADQDTRSGIAGYKADTVGFAIGADAALNDRARVGVAFAYANADVDAQSDVAQSMDVDVYQLIGYGSYNLGGNTELNFQADIGQNDNSGKRGIGFAGKTAKSDYNSFSTHLGAGIGHTLALKDGIAFTPSARLDYTAIRDEGYREKGADALNLDVSSRRVEQLIASVDGKFNFNLTDNTTMALNVGAGYDMTNHRDSITAAFAGEPGFGFNTYGVDQNRWLLRTGIGLTHIADNGTEITARYDNESRSGFGNQTASVKVRWAF